MKRQNWVSLFLTYCLLFSLLPPINALAMRTSANADWEKHAEITLELQPEITDDLRPQSTAPPGRIQTIFPDPALAQVIADAFRVTPYAVVIQADLDRVLAFSAENRDIRDLRGMERLTSLREVSLIGNHIRDLAPLADLRSLERLLLDDNQISNLALLSGLTQLRWLWLDQNQIQDITPLMELVHLEWLTLRGNQLTDITPLTRMTALESLWLGDNQIRNIEPLAALYGLEALLLADNQISDLRPLANLSRIDLIWLGEQTITLPQAVRKSPFVMENILHRPDGSFVEPDAISPGGTYDSPTLYWAEITEDVTEVSYSFYAHIDVGIASGRFYGTVTQPLASIPFADVRPSDWFYDAVAFVFEHNLMGGTSTTTFSPRAELSRAMLVTILYRMTGSPPVSGEHPFTDVPPDTWFSDAVNWAHHHGIIHGRGHPDIFAPHAPITRAEFALMLHRYAALLGHSLSIAPDFTLDTYADYIEVPTWAEEAMHWSVYHDLVTGIRSDTLAPRGLTTRAEGAMILMRYLLRFNSEDHCEEEDKTQNTLGRILAPQRIFVD